MVETRGVQVRVLGRRTYDAVLEEQRSLAAARRSGELARDVLLLVEHPPVITLGRGANRNHLTASAETLEDRGVAVADIERGGDVTYHGPGQLVAYPILDLHGYRLDLHWYLRRLEEVCLRTIAAHGLAGFRVEGFTGVWTGDSDLPTRGPGDGDGFGTISAKDASPLVAGGNVRKIASIGVHCSRWVTLHGLALNVTPEPLASFEWIVPCGISGVTMASLESEGSLTSMEAVSRVVVTAFSETFDVPCEPSI